MKKIIVGCVLGFIATVFLSLSALAEDSLLKAGHLKHFFKLALEVARNLAS
jgi:hypothetical protein